LENEPSDFGSKTRNSIAGSRWSAHWKSLLTVGLNISRNSASVEPDADRRKRILTFVVAGGGFAGVAAFQNDGTYIWDQLWR
jgi:NADH dehydrogenase FAD-containing subunit